MHENEEQPVTAVYAAVGLSAESSPTRGTPVDFNVSTPGTANKLAQEEKTGEMQNMAQARARSLKVRNVMRLHV